MLPLSICHQLQVNDPGLKFTFAIEGACYITREEWSEHHLAPVGLKRGLCILNSFILTKLSKLACIHLIIPMSKLIKLFLDLREKPGQTVCSSHYSDDRQMCNQHHRSHRHVSQWPGLFAIQQGWWVHGIILFSHNLKLDVLSTACSCNLLCIIFWSFSICQ